MKVALVQNHPHFKSVDESIRRADHLFSRVDENELNSVDLIVFPELALTGYCFDDKDDINLFCDLISSKDVGKAMILDDFEDISRIKSVYYGAQIAKKYNSNVIMGFPRFDNETNLYYNSIALISKDGLLLHLYDKKHLYYTDETWATEGSNWSLYNLNTNCKLGFAICMDLNPYQFKSDYNAFECTSFMADNNINYLSCSMAWLASSVEDDEDLKKENLNDYLLSNNTPTKFDISPNNETLLYWLNRSIPLINLSIKNKDIPIYISICNRIGKEKGNTFCGTSSFFKLLNGKPYLLDVTGQNIQDILIVDLN